MNETSLSGIPTIGPVTRRLGYGVLSGLIAILINTAILAIADSLHIVTARGGLLTLLLQVAGRPVPPFVKAWAFQQVFHIVVGIAMALVYAAIPGTARGHVLAKGLLYAFAVWLINACVVLPLIGQGFAGSHVLTARGMIVFAGAHTVFFVLNALLFARMNSGRH